MLVDLVATGSCVNTDIQRNICKLYFLSLSFLVLFSTTVSAEYVDQISFQHWPIRDARWLGYFDQSTASYPSINYENVQHSLAVIQDIVDRYAGHPAVLGLEPVNEPWQYTPIEVLKRFYWEGYLIVKQSAPYWKYIMHDSFRLDTSIWGGFMEGCPERALDTHIYQAWRDPDSRIGFYKNACSMKGALAEMEREFGPVIVGEWSLATDNCAMWLNGFNDNLPGFPRLPCKFQVCADSYLGSSQPGVPLDPSKPLQGPYGTGLSGPIYGFCPSTRDWIKESSGDPLTGRDWVKAPPGAPKHLDDTDNVMRNLALKKLDAFARIAHGFYFWVSACVSVRIILCVCACVLMEAKTSSVGRTFAQTCTILNGRTWRLWIRDGFLGAV